MPNILSPGAAKSSSTEGELVDTLITKFNGPGAESTYLALPDTEYSSFPSTISSRIMMSGKT